MTQKKLNVDLIFVTGMSGAGRSTTLKVLEDIGYAVIDNLPAFLFPEFLKGIKAGHVQLPLVVGFELRSFAGCATKTMEMIASIRDGIVVRLLFLECQDDILIKRYNVSRHRHPLGSKTLLEGIQRERALLAPVVNYADHIIDTSFVTSMTLTRILNNIFAQENSPNLEIRLMSFSYRHGIPPDADIVLDARFLENPFYEESLRPLTGKDEAVVEFLNNDYAWQTVYRSIQQMLIPTIYGFKKSGRSYLTIAAGCTGGQHRSVFMIEQLSDFLTSLGEKIITEHRELYPS
ncbi:RNase adapter RapZ [Candidatus Paracaedibacter symbiosus]|uniref:RNase adapter RapZ n=1 Tax=Candidatus Paracaedibacter symbiosus TaxID=244582 RepID=UPI0005096125|nr:RNase adapter RapZ [Candidatus Paracaedibacter symbiosus]